MKSRSGTVAVGSVALLVGATVGPTVVHAATAGLVRLQGGGSTHVAKVNSKGQLSVTDGSAHTKAGQIQATVASAGQTVTKFGFANCSSGGFYKVPTGKALIITGITFFNHPNGAGVDEQDVFIGPASTPCSTFVAAGITDGAHSSIPQTFSPGIPVPAGDALGAESVNDSGSFMVYGYLVQAGAVPAGVAQQPGTSRHGSVTTRH